MDGWPLPISTSKTVSEQPLLSFCWCTDFYQLPPVLLRRALETLVKQGKAQIFEGTERGQGLEGVKFAA